jgi:chromosome partitioning protein
MQILVIGNLKGGTGKSTSAHALGAVLAACGYHTLLVDTDPQASLTHSCGIADAEGRSLAEVLGGAEPGTLALVDVIQTIDTRLHIAPADIAMAAKERGMSERRAREHILSRVLADVAGSYDIAILDTQPALGQLTQNALVAADGVLCPTQPTAQDLRALRLFLGEVLDIRDDLNPALQIIGAVLTFYDKRYLHHQDAETVMSESGIPVIGSIPRSVRAAEAASVRQSIIEFAPDNPVSEAYRELAGKVEEWLRNEL